MVVVSPTVVCPRCRGGGRGHDHAERPRSEQARHPLHYHDPVHAQVLHWDYNSSIFTLSIKTKWKRKSFCSCLQLHCMQRHSIFVFKLTPLGTVCKCWGQLFEKGQSCSSSFIWSHNKIVVVKIEELLSAPHCGSSSSPTRRVRSPSSNCWRISSGNIYQRLSSII